MRLDHYLVQKQIAPTRSKAQQMIKEGLVKVGGVTVMKPACTVENDNVAVEQHTRYVSRAALKLKNFLPHLPFEVHGMSTLDVGASTGGFTQVLLEENAKSVDTVDVGTDQLHAALREDHRVRCFEQTDIRAFNATAPYDLVVSDVSFISLLHILDSVDRLAARWIVLLFKPQFEVGREAKRNAKGVVQDEKAIKLAQWRFENACEALGWRPIARQDASIAGKEGNREQCYCFEKC